MTLSMKSIKTYACVLGLITAFTIFFQFHVALPTGLININLADPFALLALVTLGLNTLLFRKMPQWRIAEFNWILILFGALLLFAYVIGWMKIGATQWALSARLIGWVVLLGYLSAGYLLVAHIGNNGIRRMLDVLVVAAILVIVWHLVVRLLYGYGFNVPEPTPNFEGFSGNRNAFAFQLLAVLALLLPYSKVYTCQFTAGAKRFFSGWQPWILIGFLIAGILWSASRAGILVTGIMLVVAYYRKSLDRRSTFFGCFFAALLWSAVWLLQKDAAIQSAISGAESNNERWATLQHGFNMWRHSPFIGEGLGVFMAKSAEWFGHPTVIHNTPLWILAEFGLLGAFVLGWSFWKLGIYAVKAGASGDETPRSALLLLLILFIVFSQFHELLFQRIFWLIGGVLLGVPLVLQTQTSEKAV
jgi:hypothetical protein